MNIVENSLTIVLLGDWNKLYVQPEWVANYIFCEPEMDIGVEPQGVDLKVSYMCKDIVINPTQERIVITALNNEEETVKFLAACATNYINNAQTPKLIAYGLNIDFVETENTLLSDLFDSISDIQSLVKLNYEVVNSQVNRTIKKEDIMINIQYTQEHAQSKIHFNEHYADPIDGKVIFDYKRIMSFVERCKDIAISLGYELEDDHNE